MYEERIFFPDPRECQKVADFIVEIGRLNGNSESFSYRRLSRKLRWPASLIPDVVAGRKNLSTLRVVELASFAELGPEQSSYLFLLALLGEMPTQLKPLVNECLENHKEQHVTSEYPD